LGGFEDKIVGHQTNENRREILLAHTQAPLRTDQFLCVKSHKFSVVARQANRKEEDHHEEERRDTTDAGGGGHCPLWLSFGCKRLRKYRMSKYFFCLLMLMP
jgi:hypothetical protein